MLKPDYWQPTLLKSVNNTFVVNEDYVGIGSHHIFKLQWKHYQPIFSKYLKGDLLDLGCGLVPYYEVYKNNISNLVCVDWATNNHTDFIADLNEALPIESESFDTILLSDVLNHIFNTHMLFSEMHRVLKKDGVCVITTPFLYSINGEPHDYFRFTEYGLKSLAKLHNFEIIEFTRYGNAFDIIIDSLNKLLYKKSKLLLKFASYFSKTKWYLRLNKYTQFTQGYVIVLKKTV